MGFRILIIPATLFMTGCAWLSGDTYNDDWSKAKNLTYAAGLDKQIYDQQLPPSAYNKEGELQNHDLSNVKHPADGRSTADAEPYGVFENFYWGWTTPGVSHYNEQRIFAWMPKDMAENELAARDAMERLLTRSSLAILDEMGYKHKPASTLFVHEDIPFKQWYLGKEGNSCSLDKMNCVLSLYVPEPIDDMDSPSFSFYSNANEPSWFFSASGAPTGHKKWLASFAKMGEEKYPRLILVENDGKESIPEHRFYQKLSARLPGWVYFYMPPNEVGTGDDNRTIAYPYLLEKGKPLLFVNPHKQ